MPVKSELGSGYDGISIQILYSRLFDCPTAQSDTASARMRARCFRQRLQDGERQKWKYPLAVLLPHICNLRRSDGDVSGDSRTFVVVFMLRYGCTLYLYLSSCIEPPFGERTGNTAGDHISAFRQRSAPEIVASMTFPADNAVYFEARTLRAMKANAIAGPEVRMRTETRCVPNGDRSKSGGLVLAEYAI